MWPFIGILSLDTRFPRIMGDAGNPASYHMPARVRVVSGVSSPDIVRDERPSAEVVARFIAAARELEAEGAVLITSTCGFLILLQDDIARAVRVPVLLSGLTLIPVIRRLTGDRPLGILTASARSLGTETLAKAGCSGLQIHVAGMEQHRIFAETFLTPKSAQPAALDRAAMSAAVTDVARTMIAAHPDIAGLILECGNLPPYAAQLRAAVGRPVYSILDGARLIA
ncbi:MULTISPECIES: aspartate/glutamate racemase family protein [unclassified Haematobacter]|uniref:aspartate/glutamate racemase family protein n=1 Tax=unclassified Haematobacter TaxID=2640585 RepID=UPI0025C252A9|nr:MULTISPECIES: aspartate/glutamate racemase family protein [unclassified Haematobacter]